VDERPVQIWHIASPADPEAAPRAVRYPRAGTDNAIVTLSVFAMDGGRVDVEWDREAFPYLVAVDWGRNGPLTLLVESRDQRTTQILRVDPETGVSDLVREDHDQRWLDITVGVPAWLADGRLVRTVDADDTKRLAFDDQIVTPVGLQVAQVLDVGDGVVFRANEDPTETHVCRIDAEGELTRLTREPGVHSAVVGGNVTVLSSATWTACPRPRARGRRPVARSRHHRGPVLITNPTFFVGGERPLRRHAHGLSPMAPSRCCSIRTGARTSPRSRRCSPCSWNRSGSRIRGSPSS
jgi:dipeptidyl-peptidase-4